MSAAKKFTTTLRAAAVTGVAAFAMSAVPAQAQNQNNQDQAAALNAIQIFPAPHTDNFVAVDKTGYTVVPCEGIRLPKSINAIKDPKQRTSATQNFFELQAASLLWKSNESQAERQAATRIMLEMHKACGPKPQRATFGGGQ